MPGKWIQLAPGRRFRRADDGECETERVGSIAGTVERNKRLQKAAKENPSLTDTGISMGRMVASYPEDVEQEIIDKCGMDTDKRKLFFRDHPEFLVVPPSQAGISGRSVTIPFSIPQEKWDRIFRPKRKR